MDWVEVQQQKKLMMWKAEELSMNVWHKTSSEVSRKVMMLALKTNWRSERPFIVENEFLFEMIEQQPSTSTHTLSVEFSPSQNTIN